MGIFYRDSQGPYKKIYNLPEFEACGYLNLTASLTDGQDPLKDPIFVSMIQANPAVAQFLTKTISFLKEKLSNRLRPCPIKQSLMSGYNVSAYLKLDFEKLFPSGDYRYDHHLWNDEDSNIFTRIVFERFRTNSRKLF